MIDSGEAAAGPSEGIVSGLPSVVHDKRAAFFGILAATTALPLFGLCAAVGIGHAEPTSLEQVLFPVIAITAIGHVAATTCLYVDRDYLGLMKGDRQRFIVWPLLLSAACVLIMDFRPQWWQALLVAYNAWQLHHYQRQNYGIIAFAAAASSFGKLPPSLNWVLNSATVAGFCGYLPLLGHDPFGLALPGGRLIYLGSGVLLFWLIATDPRLRRRPLVLLFALLSWGFFLPAVLFNNMLAGFWSYAIAHGAQYFIFVAISANQGCRGRRWLAAIVPLAGFVAYMALRANPAVVAGYTGLVMGHFLIDAKVWRMREPLQRALIRERFGFVFQRSATP